MSRQYSTPDWTSQDEREHNTLRQRFIASSTRRRLYLERMRERRQETANERRGLFEDTTDESFDEPSTSQSSDISVSYRKYFC